MPIATPPPDSLGSTAPALDAVRDELLALDPRTLLPVNLDVPSAALIVIGAAPEIETHRQALVALCGAEATECIDRLALLGRAAIQAHAKYRAVQAGADILPISNRLTVMRDVLLAEIRALISRQVLPASSIASLSGVHGYKNLCVDVVQLVGVLRDNWGVVEPVTGIEHSYVDQAEALANELLHAVGARGQGARSPSADLRQRAYTLLAMTYDKVRRIVSYLRWEQGDAERIAPSIFGNRGTGRRRAGTLTTELPGAEETTTTPVTAAPGMPGAPPFVE